MDLAGKVLVGSILHRTAFNCKLTKLKLFVYIKYHYFCRSDRDSQPKREQLRYLKVWKPGRK